MMNNQWMTNSRGPRKEMGLETRLLALRIIWGSFLTTIGLYVLVCFMVSGSRIRPGGDADSPRLLAALAGAALASVALSFPLKGRFYARAAGRGEPSGVQTGFIIAEALCEVAVLLGMVGVFATHNSYAFALFALGALSQLLHFPRRDQLAAAYGKAS